MPPNLFFSMFSLRPKVKNSTILEQEHILFFSLSYQFFDQFRDGKAWMWARSRRVASSFHLPAMSQKSNLFLSAPWIEDMPCEAPSAEPSVATGGAGDGNHLFESKHSNNVHRRKLKELPWQLKGPTGGGRLPFPDRYCPEHIQAISAHFFSRWKTCSPFMTVEGLLFPLWTLSVSFPLASELNGCERASCLWAATITVCLHVSPALPHHCHWSGSSSVSVLANRIRGLAETTWHGKETRRSDLH